MSARWWRWSGFALLVLLSASAWIASTIWPAESSVLLRFGVESTVVSLVLLPFSRRDVRSLHSTSRWLEIPVWGAVLLALPVALSVRAGPGISPATAALVFTLVPAVVVWVGEQQEQFGAERGFLSGLPAALAGVAGAALILPFRVPDSAAALGWLGAIVLGAVLSGFALIRLHVLLQGCTVRWSLALMCGGSGVAALVLAFSYGLAFGSLRAGWAGEFAIFALVDAPLWALTAWLLRALRPAQFAARFLLVPLVTVLEGMVLVRPSLSWTLLAGVALLAYASARLLQAPPEAAYDSPDAPGA